jgi:hypothetical protein
LIALGTAGGGLEPVCNCVLHRRDTVLHHVLVLAITGRVMPDTEPANDLCAADILKVAGLSALYALVTLASLFFAVWLIKMIWNIV